MMRRELARGGAWFYAQPLAGYLSADMRPKVEVLMLAVSFILLIGCANLAGLALVRIARRTREIATRLALGATRLEMLRQLWIENLVLAILGAAAGLALAIGILRGLHEFLPEYMLPMGGFVDGYAGAGLHLCRFAGDEPAVWRAACADDPAGGSLGRR